MTDLIRVRNLATSAHAEENVLFLAQLHIFRQARTFVAMRNIINEFVLPESSKEINVSFDVRSEVIRRFKDVEEQWGVDATIFDAAENEIHLVLAGVLLPTDAVKRGPRQRVCENASHVANICLLLATTVHFVAVDVWPQNVLYRAVAFACHLAVVLALAVLHAYRHDSDMRTRGSMANILNHSNRRRQRSVSQSRFVAR